MRSVIDYALPVFLGTLNITEIARLEQFQYRAGKVVTGAFHFTSQDKLKKRYNILGLNIFRLNHTL